jgi:hypothetical protein
VRKVAVLILMADPPPWTKARVPDFLTPINTEIPAMPSFPTIPTSRAERSETLESNEMRELFGK